MSQSVKKILQNSFLQTINVFSTTGLNFILMLGYARLLGPEKLGTLVTAQAHIFIGIILVDLGMSNGLIATLTRAEGLKLSLGRQSFRAFDLIKQVLLLRVSGASFAFASACFFSYLSVRNMEGFEIKQSEFLKNIAFAPYLFAYAFQQTLTAYGIFRKLQGLCVFANIIGIFISVAMALTLAWNGAAVSEILFAQSSGGIFASVIIVIGFVVWPKNLVKENIRNIKSNSRFWKKNAVSALFRDAWPHTLVFAILTIWQRIDQIFASHLLGFEAGGQYGLAIRVVAIPILVASAIFIALFPELQRIGRDEPEKIAVYIGAVTKFLFRYGLFIAIILLYLLMNILTPILPKFQQALKLLPWFVPGIFAYWMYNFMIGSLWGLRKYKEIVVLHGIAFLFYLIYLPLLTKKFHLLGVIASYNIFAICLALLSYYVLKRMKILPSAHRVWKKYSSQEEIFINEMLQKIFFNLKRKHDVL